MNQFSEDYQPSYELFAVIANKGEDLVGNKDKDNKPKNNKYVTIIKRENGDIFEFDANADAPKQLEGDDDMLRERRTAELLFYREVPRETRDQGEQSSQSSNTSSEPSVESDEQIPQNQNAEVEMVPVKSKPKRTKI